MTYRNILSASAIICVTLAALTGCASGGQSPSSSPNSNSSQPSATNTADAGNTNQTATTTPSNASGDAGGSSLPTQVASGNGSVTTSQAGATSGTASSFPRIVDMAMSHLSPAVKVGAEAPKMFPEASDGSVNLFFHTYQSATRQMGFPGMETMYRVQFSSARDPLASFLGVRYDSTANATNGFMAEIGTMEAQGTQSSIGLAYNHKGTLGVDTANNRASIVWTEGRWGIRVTNLNSTTANTAVANQVVSYLQTHFMPVPHDKAAITVDVEGSKTTVMVAWQESNELYQIDVQPQCKNPVQTALAMAISMHTYP